MTSKELTRLSLIELTALRDKVTALIEQKHESARGEALNKIKEIAKRAGIDLSELGKTRNRKAKVRYRHPDDSSKTWVGRGRTPFWLKDELEAGKSLEDFAI